MIRSGSFPERGYDLLRRVPTGRWPSRTTGLDGSTVSRLESTVPDGRAAYALRPSRSRDRSGLDTSLKLWNGLWEHLDGPADFEIRHDGETRLHASVPAAAADRFETLMEAFFPACELDTVEDATPDFEPGHRVAGARLGLRADYLLPIGNPVGVSLMETEPYNELVRSMAASPGAGTLVQVAFEPAPERWWERRVRPLLPDPGSNLTPLRPTTLTCETVADAHALDVSEQARSVLAGQRGQRAFVASIRVLAWAADADAAVEATEGVASALAEAFVEPELDQGLAATVLFGRELPVHLERYARRRVVRRRQWLGTGKREPCVLTVPELTALAHVPSRLRNDRYRLDAPSLNWAGDGTDGTDGTDEGEGAEESPERRPRSESRE